MATHLNLAFGILRIKTSLHFQVEILKQEMSKEGA